jgi:DNA polymerase-3 subunit delta
MAKPTSIDVYKQALLSIRSADRKPVYYFYGEESFFPDLLQDEILKLLPPEQRDFNLDILYGNEVSPSKALGVARSYPMMSELRIVLIREFNQIATGNEDGGSINDFAHFIEQPNPSAILCMVDEKVPDKRTQFGKALVNSKNVGLYGFDLLPDYKLPDWVNDWVRHKYKKEIEPPAAQIMAQLVGNHLQLLSTEIDKVCTFVDTSERITVEDVKKIIGSYREYSVIELKDALLERNSEKSLQIAEQMLHKSNADAGEVIRSVGFLYSVFSNIWQVKRLEERGLNSRQIQSELDIKSDYYFKRLSGEAKNYRLADLPRIFEAFLDADKAAKGFTTLDTSSILLLLIKRILG